MSKLEFQQTYVPYPADIQTPISLYLDFVGNQPGILLESAEVDGRLGRYSLIAWDFLLVMHCVQDKLELNINHQILAPLKTLKGTEFIPGLRQVMKQLSVLPPRQQPPLPPLTRALLGYFGYELSGLLEPRLTSLLIPSPDDFPKGPKAEDKTLQQSADPLARLVLPGKQILFDHLHHRCFFISLDGAQELKPQARSIPDNGQVHVGPVTNVPGKERFCKNVQETKELIHQGEAIQVVLSTRFQASFQGNPFSLYRRLRQANPSPYMFYLNFNEMQLIGSSPELLVRSTRGHLELRPIAGTRPRGKEDTKDRELAQDLLQDPKERAEHVMLVDLGRNDLGRIAQSGSVVVEKFMQVERFSHVMHLTSYIQAELKPGLDSLDLLQATFPAGTVSGAPKIRAMEIIAEKESLARGPYAGAVAWLGLDQQGVNLDTGITIRSLWIKDGEVHWQAGAGIVSDSIPEKEWEECQNKARVIKQILTQDGGSDAFAHR